MALFHRFWVETIELAILRTFRLRRFSLPCLFENLYNKQKCFGHIPNMAEVKNRKSGTHGKLMAIMAVVAETHGKLMGVEKSSFLMHTYVQKNNVYDFATDCSNKHIALCSRSCLCIKTL